MMWSWRLLGVVAMVSVVAVHVAAQSTNETEGAEFLDIYNRQSQFFKNNVMEKYWTYECNITVENQQAAVEASLQTALWSQNMSRLAALFRTDNFPDDMKRQFAKIKDIGTDALNDTSKLEQLKSVLAQLATIYSTAKVCPKEVCEEGSSGLISLDPEITRTLETSRDEKLLRRLWKRWRDETGKKMKQLYTQFVSLSNEAVQTLGYADTGAYWRSKYETETFERDVAALFEELKPLYLQLHAFVRRRLKERYGADLFPPSGHIPGHLLGNMWAHTWSSLQDMLLPFPNKTILDVTQQMVQQNYTARKIFETADDFFTSLGLQPMPQAFWDKSMLEKPDDGREVVCHASAWDFRNGVDFRVKQCTEVTMDHFSTAHHEMGHVEYYLHYKHLPVVFRRGANPGFHEAVGDTISLSVETPKHLHQIGLLPSLEEDRESDLNFLMAMALQKIAFLPFAYLVDLWRWSVFSGDTTASNYNQAWWDLRCNLQGVSPPVERTEDDFDPGSKFHIPDNTPYVRYFVSHVLQFQFHKALCEAAGHQGPLHTCDIYNSTVAGDRLRAMLSKGSSEVWTVPFQALTGQTNMSVQPLIQYFQPLMDYLKMVNGEDVGWSEGCPRAMVVGPGGGKDTSSVKNSSAGLVSFTFLLLISVILVTLLF